MFIKVWKPLPSIHILKILKGNLKGKGQIGQYLLAVGLGRYKWYQSQTPNDVPRRRLSPKGGWTRGGVPTRMLDPRRGVDWGVPHRLEKGMSALRTLGPEGVDWEIPHRLGRRTKHSLYRCENLSLTDAF